MHPNTPTERYPSKLTEAGFSAKNRTKNSWSIKGQALVKLPDLLFVDVLRTAAFADYPNEGREVEGKVQELHCWIVQSARQRRKRRRRRQVREREKRCVWETCLKASDEGERERERGARWTRGY